MGDEVAEYRAQISAINGQLKAGDVDDETREELAQTRDDLLELVALLEEEEESTPTSSGAGAGLRADDDDDEGDDEQRFEQMDDVIGTRCAAPFPRHDLPLTKHSAVILDVEPGVDADVTKVRVLYSHPMVAAMRPCSHFMAGTCRFEAKCRFSHGELVALSSIAEYQEPDFSSLEEGSLVLVGKSDLWELGRITAVDEHEVAVKLLKTGQEVSSPREGLVPVDDDVTEADQADVERLQKDDESRAAAGNGQWAELKGDRLGNVSVGELGNWTGGGVGLKLMQKMGYQLGQGLGKNSDGIVHAIQATICPKNSSVDECMKRKRKVVDGTTVISAKKKKRMQKALDMANCVERDIFVFINQKLETHLSAKPEHVRMKEEKKELEKYSAKSLGIKGVDLEIELKQLRAKEKKLREGIARNKGDQKTVARMEGSLRELQDDIGRVQRKQNSVNSEMQDRSKNKKSIF